MFNVILVFTLVSKKTNYSTTNRRPLTTHYASMNPSNHQPLQRYPSTISPVPDTPTTVSEVPPSSPLSKFLNFFVNNNFLLGILCSILLAYVYPKLGAVYLFPNITANYIAVIYIFLMSGIGLKSNELLNAFKDYQFNLMVQSVNLLLVSGLTFFLASLLKTFEVTSDELADGLIITSCLPMTINMVIVFTIAGGGDEASAVFNAALGNLMGVFVTPALVILYLDESNSISLLDVLFKLAVRVLAPLFVGQVIQYKVKVVKDFVADHKPAFKKSQEIALTYIVYSVFCVTFYSKAEPGAATATAADVGAMAAVVVLWLLVIMALAWFLFALLFKDEPELRVFALFGSSHKTLSMGIPLLSAMFEGERGGGERYLKRRRRIWFISTSI